VLLRLLVWCVPLRLLFPCGCADKSCTACMLAAISRRMPAAAYATAS